MPASELEQLIKDFPNLAHLNETVKELRQQAQQIIKEIELCRDAGQYRFAVQLLESFPPDGVAGETLLKVRELLEEIQGQVKPGRKAFAAHRRECRGSSRRSGAG